MTIKVDYATLDRAADDIDGTVKAMNSTLEELKANVNRLVSTWEGEAQEAYYVKQRQWDESADALNEILAKIGGAVSEARARYHEGEMSNRNMFQ